MLEGGGGVLSRIGRKLLAYEKCEESYDINTGPGGPTATNPPPCRAEVLLQATLLNGFLPGDQECSTKFCENIFINGMGYQIP